MGWAQAKAVVDLDWRRAWREIAAGVVGEQPAQVYVLLDKLDSAYQAQDRVAFLHLMTVLANQPSWTGSLPSSEGQQVVTSGRSTGDPSKPACPISSDLFTDDASLSNVSALVKPPRRSKRRS